MDNKYNVDDILSEIKGRKMREKGVPQPPRGAAPQQHQGPEYPGEQELYEQPYDPQHYGQQPYGQQPPPPPEPAPPVEEPLEELKLDFGRPRVRQPRPPVQAPPPAPAPSPEDRQATTQFQFVSPEVQQPSQGQSPLNFEGHVRPLTDKARMRRNPAGQGEGGFTAFRPQDTSEHTRVLPHFGEPRDLSLEELQNDIASSYAGGYDDYDDDYGDDTPLVSNIDFSEYNSTSDRRDVQRDIARTKLWLVLRCVLTVLLTGFLFVMAFSIDYVIAFMPAAIDPQENLFMFLLVNTIVTVLVALINSSAVGGGLISLVRMRANSDTLAALALLAAIGQGVALVVSADSVNPRTNSLYFCVAALAMLFGVFGKLSMINRIQSNFRIIASDQEKRAVLRVESDEMCRDLTEADSRRPTVAFGARAGFFTDFLALSYSDKYDVGINRAVAPVCLGGALVVGCVTYFLQGSALTAITAITAILCVCASLSATFVENIPLGKLTKRLAPLGGMVSGNKAVEDFCDLRGLILSDNDLFPEGNVQLRGIKSFSQGRIDEAIVDAASVICALDGALAPVFLGIIGGNRKLLRPVDNIVFEQGMGVSAWVSGRRVLVGNRKLMQHHGVILPDIPEQKYARDPGEHLYVSNSGEVSARFTIGYIIDEELAAQLDMLASREVVLTVQTADPGITPHKMWELYGYPEEYIRVLPAKYQQQFEQMSAPRDTAMAEIAYTGRASAMVGALMACVSARASILAATVLSLVQMVLGYSAVTILSFLGSANGIAFTQLCIYQLFWFLLIFIVQKLRHT